MAGAGWFPARARSRRWPRTRRAGRRERRVSLARLLGTLRAKARVGALLDPSGDIAHEVHGLPELLRGLAGGELAIQARLGGVAGILLGLGVPAGAEKVVERGLIVGSGRLLVGGRC